MSKFDITIDQSIERMIAANAYLYAGFNLGATLAHNNAAGRYQLTVVAFDAKHLWFAIATIARATHSFFMCHDELLLCARCGLFRAGAAAACSLGSVGRRFLSFGPYWSDLVLALLFNGSLFFYGS